MRELTINEVQAISAGLSDAFYQSVDRAFLLAAAGAALIHFGNSTLETCSPSLTSNLSAFTSITVGTCFVGVSIVSAGLLVCFAFAFDFD